MKEYHKIEAVFNRDTTGSKKLIEGDFRDETIAFLANTINWIWTEKVDGTNIRVFWDGHEVSFGGRTDKAQIPAHLVTRLEELFKTNEAEEMFEQMFGENEVILFGEGYGAKIQNGGNYTDGKSCDFILFDIMVGNLYLKREAVNEIAQAFGIKVVPVVGIGTLNEAITYIKTHPFSMLGNNKHEMEGVVCRPVVELNDRRGRRIIVKIKYEDFVC